jgi:DNA-binding MarR family transcriptional regulator
MIFTPANAVEYGDLNVGEPRLSPQQKSINFRIHTLASSLFKGAAQYYGAHFGVGLPEMRVLSNLGSEGPLAARRIIELTAMDKALVSRVLTVLNCRGYLTSSSPKSDPRRRTWQLSRAGQDLVKRLRPEWQRREAIIQAELSAPERDVLANLLDRMLRASEKLRAEEAIKVQVARRSPAKAPARRRRANGRADDHAGTGETLHGI